MPRARGRSGGTAGKRGVGTRQQSTRSKRKTQTPRPVVISLDVTYSSDELEDNLSDYAPSPSPEPPKEEEQEQPLFTPSPSPEKQVVRGIMSDSESDCEEILPAETPNAKRVKVDSSPYDAQDDSTDDIFAVDFNSWRNNAKKDALKEIKEMMAVEKDTKVDKAKKEAECSEAAELSNLGDEISCVEDDVIVIDGSSNDTPSPMPKVKVSKRKMLKRNSETKKAMKELQALAKDVKDNNDSMNQSGISDILILSDDECDNSDSEMMLRVRFESEYLRLPIKKMQKFSHIYQVLAERFSVGVSQIILSHRDKIIDPEICPKQLGLTIADIIEGGIQSKNYSNGTESTEENNPGNIRLKVQNASKKGVVTIHINRYDKMQVLMQRYAEEKKVDLSALRFHFDGEKLDPSDTPDNLDLDGDECIDVYHS
ncbi:hepatoma-derived growth factor-related protein 2-like [Penaeus japonicus]|uniref:hepatoma-derived growth factor-related protein 2-like n=1 Tax=Penaeus japonicus TaxID=27405 RepID=UPI001C711931|nr:hepatoma-derived growth factor-related protein 2-like [Penaeus japonicus]